MTARDRGGDRLRSVFAFARLTMKELLRRGLLPFSFIAYAVFLAFLDIPVELDEGAARARFLDQAFAVAAASLVLVAAVCGVQLSQDRDRERSGDGLTLLKIGAPRHFFGRSLGLIAALAALGMCLSVVAIINIAARFGDVLGEERPLREVHEARNFKNDREVKRSKKGSVNAELRFELPPGTDERQLEFRFLPRLYLTGSPAEIRGACPVAFRLSDRASSWSRRRVLSLHEGKALRFDLDLPPQVRELDVVVENLSPSWSFGIDQHAAVIFGDRRSLPATILRGGLLLGLFASVFGIFGLYFRTWVGPGLALVLSLSLATVAASLDLIEEGVLAETGAALRASLAVLLSIVLPDFDGYDVSSRLVRGIALGWMPVLELLLRLTCTLVLLRFVLRRRR